MFEKDPTGPAEPNASKASILSELPDFDTHLAEISAKDAEKPADPEKLANLEKFTDFLERDFAVKKALVSLAPAEQDFYNADSAISYADRFYEGFKDISSDLKVMMREYYPSEDIEKRLAAIQTNLINAGANPRALSETYRRDFTDMSEEFVENVGRETAGYSMFSFPHSLDGQAKSVNEILHLMHAATVNNEYILQSLPVLEQSPAGEVVLYGSDGVDNPIAKEIFNGMKDDESFKTDIVALKDRTLMMVRDRGHALTVDVEKDPDGKYYTSYFIPKICNVDKVNLLPGVRPVVKKPGSDQVRETTTGIFAIDSATDVPSRVLDFISRVPTDEDIVWQ